MESTKICANGHRYSADLPECPFCPKYSPADPTIIDQPLPNPPFPNRSGSEGKTVIVPPPSTPSAQSPQPQKGTIIMPPPETQKSSEGAVPRPQREAKLVGWLVTFTWNPAGDDFKLREGKMSIGRDPDNDIVLPDGLASGKHAQIRFQNGQLKIKDNFSTNGTYVNGEDIGDTAFLLRDKDQIKIGNTILEVHLI